MIPYAGQGGAHNSKEGMVFLFRIFGGITLLLWLGAGIFDSNWDNWGMLALGAGFFGLSWLISKG